MSLTMDRWLNDTTVLTGLRTSWNDKLEVTEGGLRLDKGQHSRDRGVSIMPRPTVVADYLEALMKTTAEDYFRVLQASKTDSPAFYEQVADFKRQVKCLYQCLSDLQYTFRSHDCQDERSAVRYDQLFYIAHALRNRVKDYKSTLKKPPLTERPIKHIEYNERIDLNSIKWGYPKRVPIQETVAAAKQALSLARGESQPSYIRCIKAIGNGLLHAPALLGASILTALKIVLWNPLEWLIRGEVRTISPLRWMLQELRNDNVHMRAYQRFSNQLFRQPLITEKVADAFKQLAPEANLLDLENVVLAAEDITELAPFIKEDKSPGAIPLMTYLNTMKKLCEEKNIKLHTLRTVSCLYEAYNRAYKTKEGQSIENFLDDISNRKRNKDADILPAHAMNPYISLPVLKEVLKAASSSSTCREIKISDSLLGLQFVRDFLNQHSYRLESESGVDKTYRRYSLI